MENKKGFTLLELMGVMIIISLISILTFPNIVNQIKKSKASNKKMIEDIIISQAEKYVSDNPADFSDDGYCLSIDTLIDNGYVKEDIINSSEDNLKNKYITLNNQGSMIVKEKCNLNPGYIEDSLIVFLDGKNSTAYQKDSLQMWYDLSENENNFNFMNNVSYMNDSYYVNNETVSVSSSTSYIYNDSNNIVFNKNKSFTLELVFLRTNNNGNIMSSINGTATNEIWSNNSTKQICIRFINCRYCSGSVYNITQPTYIGITYNSSSNSMKYYINGTLVNSATASTTIVEYGITLGMRKQGSASKSRFYTLRYYTKELSQDEIINNYNIDKGRYKIIG